MQHGAMVRRAQQSVTPYWKQRTWAAWVAQKLLPERLASALTVAYPGTFKAVPGFSE
nr:MAG: RNA-dependent RNA polymerase [Crogonang virus 68]